MTRGDARISSGDDRIHVKNGEVRHRWTQIRGALPKLAGTSLHATGFTPFRRTLAFRSGGVGR
jgi:hypothetical protein